MLKSYAIAIERMLKLPATDSRNWFRNAFVHFMDCPHGNWWFWGWHRGYVGLFEQTVRSLSDNPAFAFPYWDWTETPQIPSEMFDGVLTPMAAAYAPYTKDLDTFTAFIKPTMEQYWNTLNADQRKQLALRGYTSFGLLWNDVTGYNPKTGQVDPGNQAFATNARARYLTRDNPKFDDKTAAACAASVIDAGLAPQEFYNDDVTLSFASSKTASHLSMPGKGTNFCVLEGQPHNLVHNYIGGVGPWNPGPFGNMTQFLSPVDPIFFLHHSNIDRLWDLWTSKQQRLGLPELPQGKDLDVFMGDPFRFFVKADGTFILDGKAGDYVSTSAFGYMYELPASTQISAAHDTTKPASSIRATLKHGVASLNLSAATLDAIRSDPKRPIITALTVPRSADPNGARQFDVVINAPAGLQSVTADSPYYGGTVAFFGPPMHGMAHGATFAVPLQPRHRMLAAAAPQAGAPVKLELRLVPASPNDKPAPVLKGATLRRL